MDSFRFPLTCSNHLLHHCIRKVETLLNYLKLSEEVTEKENASLVCQIGWEVSIVVGRSDRVRQEEKQGSNIIDGCGLGTTRDRSSEPGSARTAATAQVPCRLDMSLKFKKRQASMYSTIKSSCYFTPLIIFSEVDVLRVMVLDHARSLGPKQKSQRIYLQAVYL